MSYIVVVDDNFRFMDEDQRYTLGELATLDAAIDACKAVVDEFIRGAHRAGMSADSLYATYAALGEDPFIAAAGVPPPFSAWDYARQRCEQFCLTGQSSESR